MSEATLAMPSGEVPMYSPEDGSTPMEQLKGLIDRRDIQMSYVDDELAQENLKRTLAAYLYAQQQCAILDMKMHAVEAAGCRRRAADMDIEISDLQATMDLSSDVGDGGVEGGS